MSFVIDVYYNNFPEDKSHIRALGKCSDLLLIFRMIARSFFQVWGTFIMEIVQTVCYSHQAYWYMVEFWGNANELATQFPWSSMTIPTIEGVSKCTFLCICIIF